MRSPAILIGAVIILAASSAAGATYTEADLLEVSTHPELAGYADKVREALHVSGKRCDGIVKMNAFPQGGTSMLAVAHCSGGQKKEALWNGSSVQITQLA